MLTVTNSQWRSHSTLNKWTHYSHKYYTWNPAHPSLTHTIFLFQFSTPPSHLSASLTFSSASSHHYMHPKFNASFHCLPLHWQHIHFKLQGSQWVQPSHPINILTVLICTFSTGPSWLPHPHTLTPYSNTEPTSISNNLLNVSPLTSPTDALHLSIQNSTNSSTSHTTTPSPDKIWHG